MGWGSSLEQPVGFDGLLLPFNVTVQLERVEPCVQELQRLLLFRRHLRRGQHAGQRSLRVAIHPGDASVLADFLRQLVRGQEVVLQLTQRALAQYVDQRRDRRVVVALVAELLAHVRPVALLDVGVVVLLVGPRAREEDGLGPLPRPRHDVVVDELPAVVAVHAQQREWQARFHVLQLRQSAMLAAVFQRTLLCPVRADVHRVEHPEVTVIQRAAAQGHRVHLHPARPFLRPFAANGNALAQQIAGPRAAASPQRHAQRCEQSIQRARADGQQALAHVGIQTPMIRLVSRQPFGQQRDEPAAAGLEGGEPDGLEDRQQRVGMILARTTQDQRH